MYLDGIETDEEVEMKHVYEEFDAVRQKYHVKKYMSRPVTRKYAFELPDVPEESEYLKVVYSYDR